MSVAWSSEPGNSGRRTWVVDHAGDLAELERRLNHLDEEGFRIHSLYQIVVGMEPAALVIVAFRAWDRWKQWALMAATAAAFTLLCCLRRFLGL